VDCKQLTGCVFVADCPNPGSWLQQIAAARVSETVVLLPVGTDDDWFRQIDKGGWCCCFLRGHVPRLVAYLGSRRHAFWLVFNKIGTVLQPYEHD
jgi:hypothetical protein